MKPLKHRAGNRTYWVVRIGRRLGAAKAEKKYFNTRSEANDYVEQILDARERLGRAAFSLTFEQQAEAVQALKRLAPYGISLGAAVDYYCDNHPNGKASPLFGAFVQEFLTARKISCKPHTLATYSSQFKPALKEFRKVPLNQIRQTDIEEWAAELDFEPRTIRNLVDTLTTLFNDGLRKGFIARNPAEFVPRPPLVATTPGILTPAQAKELLAAARRDRPRLIPAIAIALFAGVRRSELCALTRQSIKGSCLEVPAIVSKTRQRRLVTIQPNLAAWLKAFPPPEGEPLTETRNPDVFGEWLRALAQAANIVPWPHNAMRHSFGSYLYALSKNESAVAADMGNSPEVLLRHYRALVAPEEAQAYFDIRPSARKPKRRRRT